MPTEGCPGVPCETMLSCRVVTTDWWWGVVASVALPAMPKVDAPTPGDTGSGCAMGSSPGTQGSREQPVLLQDGAQPESCEKRTEMPLKGPWPRQGWEGGRPRAQAASFLVSPAKTRPWPVGESQIL